MPFAGGGVLSTDAGPCVCRTERVTAEEAEPFQVPDSLPATAHRVDGSPKLYVDIEEAVAALKDGGSASFRGRWPRVGGGTRLP